MGSILLAVIVVVGTVWFEDWYHTRKLKKDKKRGEK